MKHAGLIAALLIAATTAVAAASGRTSASPTPALCGGSLWQLKTLSDPGRTSVRLASATTTIEAIAGRPYPRPVPTKRRTAFQRHTWEVVAQLTAYRLEAGGVRLILFDANSYMNAVIPLPSCLSPQTRARNQIGAAWTQFSADCAHPKNEWQSLGAIVYIRGVGFWSQRRGLRGAARNGAELHPVTGFRIVAGC
jgi:hypothetical protein